MQSFADKDLLNRDNCKLVTSKDKFECGTFVASSGWPCMGGSDRPCVGGSGRACV